MKAAGWKTRRKPQATTAGSRAAGIECGADGRRCPAAARVCLREVMGVLREARASAGRRWERSLGFGLRVALLNGVARRRAGAMARSHEESSFATNQP